MESDVHTKLIKWTPYFNKGHKYRSQRRKSQVSWTNISFWCWFWTSEIEIPFPWTAYEITNYSFDTTLQHTFYTMCTALYLGRWIFPAQLNCILYTKCYSSYNNLFFIPVPSTNTGIKWSLLIYHERKEEWNGFFINLRCYVELIWTSSLGSDTFNVRI